jgi:hypothetical protein
MARGFDSKAVTDQQEDLLRADEPKREVPQVSARRRTLELARTDLLHRIEATPEGGRAQLRAALVALDDLIGRS